MLLHAKCIPTAEQNCVEIQGFRYHIEIFNRKHSPFYEISIRWKYPAGTQYWRDDDVQCIANM